MRAFTREKAIRATVLLLITALCLCPAGCGRDERLTLSDVETRYVENEYGFSFTVPADWTEFEMTESVELGGETAETAETAETSDKPWADDFTHYRFVSADESCTMLVMSELGGMEYTDSETNLFNMAAALRDSFTSGTVGEISGDDRHCSCSVEAQDAEGRAYICRVEQWHPYTSLRFYLIFTAAKEDYQTNELLVDGICDSFDVFLTDEEMYQLIQNKRDAEQEKLLEQYYQLQENTEK